MNYLVLSWYQLLDWWLTFTIVSINISIGDSHAIDIGTGINHYTGVGADVDVSENPQVAFWYALVNYVYAIYNNILIVNRIRY